MCHHHAADAHPHATREVEGSGRRDHGLLKDLLMKMLLALFTLTIAFLLGACTPAEEATTPSNLPLDGGIGDGVNPPGGAGI